MENKPKQSIRLLMIGYPMLVLLTTTLRSYLLWARRTIFLAVHIIPIIIVSGIILLHFLPNIISEIKENKIWKSLDFPDYPAIFVFFEINIVTLIFILNGTTVPARAVDVPLYDVILITGAVISHYMTEKDRFLMVRILSLVISIAAVFFLVELIYSYSVGKGYASSRGIFNDGISTVFMIMMGFWLPSFFSSDSAKFFHKILCAAVLVLSLRRAVWLGLAFSCGMYIVWHGKTLFGQIKVKRKYIWMVLAGAIITFVLLLSTSFAREIAGRFTNLQSSHATAGRLGFTAENIRRFIFEDTWMGRIWGHGRDTVGPFMRSWVGYEDLLNGYDGPHNQYITTLYEFGIVGVCSMFYLMTCALRVGKYLEGTKRSIGFCLIVMILPAVFEDIGDSFFISSMAVVITAYMLPFIHDVKTEKQKNQNKTTG